MNEPIWKPIGPTLGEGYVVMRRSESGTETFGRRSPEASGMLEDDSGDILSPVWEIRGGVARIIAESAYPVDEWRPLTEDEREGLAESLRHKARMMREWAARATAEADALSVSGP